MNHLRDGSNHRSSHESSRNLLPQGSGLRIVVDPLHFRAHKSETHDARVWRSHLQHREDGDESLAIRTRCPNCGFKKVGCRETEALFSLYGIRYLFYILKYIVGNTGIELLQ